MLCALITHMPGQALTHRTITMTCARIADALTRRPTRSTAVRAAHTLRLRAHAARLRVHSRAAALLGGYLLSRSHACSPAQRLDGRGGDACGGRDGHSEHDYGRWRGLSLPRRRRLWRRAGGGAWRRAWRRRWRTAARTRCHTTPASSRATAGARSTTHATTASLRAASSTSAAEASSHLERTA